MRSKTWFAAAALSLIVAISYAWADGPAAAPPAASQPASASGPVTITVFDTNDIHDHMEGFQQVIGYVRAFRAKNPNTLLLDAGDMTGTGEEALGITRAEAMWRMALAAGYDAVIFGNHDHGNGKARLIELGEKYPAMPMLMANVKFGENEKQLAERFPPYKIFKLQGVRVAVIGVSSSDVRYTKKNRFELYSEVPIVHQYVRKLRKEADIFIAITHLDEGSDLAIGSGPDAPDLIIGGHSHGAPCTVWGRERKSFLIKAGRYGRLLGKVTIAWDGTKISSLKGELLGPKDDWPEDEQVTTILKAYRKANEERKAKDAKPK